MVFLQSVQWFELMDVIDLLYYIYNIVYAIIQSQQCRWVADRFYNRAQNLIIGIKKINYLLNLKKNTVAFDFSYEWKILIRDHHYVL